MASPRTRCPHCGKKVDRFLGVLPRKAAQAKRWRYHLARTREIEGGGIRVVAPETVGCCQWGDHWTDAPVVEG
jgi:hypothetical protein